MSVTITRPRLDRDGEPVGDASGTAPISRQCQPELTPTAPRCRTVT
jgi:hypothetical protein